MSHTFCAHTAHMLTGMLEVCHAPQARELLFWSWHALPSDPQRRRDLFGTPRYGGRGPTPLSQCTTANWSFDGDWRHLWQISSFSSAVLIVQSITLETLDWAHSAWILSLKCAWMASQLFPAGCTCSVTGTGRTITHASFVKIMTFKTVIAEKPSSRHKKPNVCSPASQKGRTLIQLNLTAKVRDKQHHLPSAARLSPAWSDTAVRIWTQDLAYVPRSPARGWLYWPQYQHKGWSRT